MTRKIWSINSCTKNNANHMIIHKKAYIGLGLSGEIPDDEPNVKRYYKGRTSHNSTPFQFIHFNTRKKKDDIIILYENGKGHTHYGKLTGIITKPKFGRDLAPDWEINEIQYHIQVYKWIQIENPHNKHVRRTTLSELSETEFISIIGC